MSKRKPRPFMLLIRELERSDVLEPEQANAAKKAARKLDRSVQFGKRQHIFSAVNELAKIFLKEVIRSN